MIKGKNVVVIDGTNHAVVAAARSCDIDVDCEMIEVAGLGQGGWRHYRKGRKGWTVNIGHLLATGGLQGALLRPGGDYVIKIAETNNNGVVQSVTVTGNAVCERVKLTGTVGNLAQGSAVFRGNGGLL